MTLFRSWLFWLALPASLLAVFMLGITLLLANLDRPSFKTWLNRQLALPHGIAIDYRNMDLAPLSGRLQIDGLKISAPEIHRRHTPLLLDLGRLSAHWSYRSLLSRKFTLREFKIDELAIHTVLQEEGLSTLDLFRDDAPDDDPEQPLSHTLQLADLPMAVLVEHARFNSLSLSQTELDSRGDLIGRQRLDGIDINATAYLIPGDVSARIQIDSAERSEGLQLSDYQTETQQTRSMDLGFASNLTIDASRNVRLSVQSNLLRQTFDSGLAIGGSIIDIDAQALFDNEAHDTKLNLTKLQLLDTAAQAELIANWPDNAPLPLLQTGSGSIHVDPLLAAWPALIPDTDVESMRLNYRIESIAGNDQAIKLSVDGEAESIKSDQNGQKLDLKNLSLQLNGAIDWPERADFQLSIPIGKVSYLDAAASELELQRALLTVNAENFPMRLDRPFSAGGVLNVSALKFNSEQTPIEQTNLQWTLAIFEPNEAQSLPSHAELTLTGTVDELTLDANATLEDANLNTAINAQTDALGALVRKLPVNMEQLANVNLEKTAAEAQLQGRYRNIDQPQAISLDHELSATVKNIAVHDSELTAEFPVVQLHAKHHGGENRHSLDLNLTSQQTRLNDVLLEQDPVSSLSAEFAPTKSTARMTMAIGSQLSAAATAEFESSSAILRHNGNLELKQPAMLAKWLPEAHAVDWQTFSAKLTQRGTIAGLLEANTDTGMPVLTSGFADKLLASQQIDLNLNNIAYRDNELSIRAPVLKLALNGRQRGRKIQAGVNIAAPSLSINERNEVIELTEMTHQLDITGDSRLAGGDIEIRIDGSLKNAEQSYFPLYPIRDLSLSGRAHSSRLESFVLDDLTLNNRGGGTRLSLNKTLNRVGVVDSGGIQQSSWRELNLNGEITQSLAELDTAPELFQGRGALSAPITINSSDGTLFNIKATLNLNDVNAALPDQELHVDGLNGRVQLSETIEWDAENGFSLVHDSERNHFARIRYQDVQPFLSNQSFFKIGRIRWKNLEAAPIIGSLHIQNNVFSLNKLKLKKGAGTISGQLIVDYFPGAERFKFRGNATGLRIGESRERIDGNMAFVFLPAKLEIDGRLQILRLSRQHLVELLDLLDPFREDPALNKLRLPLAFGYPNFVRMEMAQGLASMKVDLGGIGGALIDIEEIRGIPLGPFMSRHVAPLLQLNE
ncbi:hypothetical protein [Methylotuvimicrobium buryatense]|uniref:Uncharacterized protein n=1 Tax=Methylotuvimicrobium buryatense TaxID=95641 RepID=A0A4P9USH2_METBY|nr:hypothetical protein [Methylotuvimicrobium buryatense]QCW84474.1 hypothetical protein EQU24_21205 [Methylotuvimicrobium buryatense]